MRKIMIIGGTDSSGGAGLTRDTSVARILGFDVLPIVTAVTAQSNGQMFDARMMPADFVVTQIKSALASDSPEAIKIGMLGTDDIAMAVGDALSELSIPVVLDPVLKSSSGGKLMTGDFPQQLLSLTSLITPNLPETAALSGRPMARTEDEIATQAELILARGAKAVLIKGGHAEGKSSSDHLIDASQNVVFHAPRLDATMRGTGCALATLIACHLADKYSLDTACRKAKEIVYGWLRTEPVEDAR